MSFIKDLVSDVLGTYTPVTVDGVLVGGVAGIDWPYIFSGLLFVLLIYSLVRIVGAIICRIF